MITCATLFYKRVESIFYPVYKNYSMQNQARKELLSIKAITKHLLITPINKYLALPHVRT